MAVAAARRAATSGPAPRTSRLELASTWGRAPAKVRRSASTVPPCAPNPGARIGRVGRDQVDPEVLDRVADGGADDQADAAELAAGRRVGVVGGGAVHDGRRDRPVGPDGVLHLEPLGVRRQGQDEHAAPGLLRQVQRPAAASRTRGTG